VKTAISIDEKLLREADETARLMGLSRSRLFALAIGEFLQRQRLNEVYANGLDPAEKRLLISVKARVRTTVKESW
jgi:predicted transcriptional regulator